VREPAMDIWTIVQGLEKEEPLIGRFVIGDAVCRCFSGHLITPAENLPAPSTWSNVSTVPTWDEVKMRFQSSEVGVKLRELVDKQAKRAVEFFKAKEYGEALPLFQWVSVYGFFTHSADEQYAILKNLASGYERFLTATKEDTTIALLWAREAQIVRDTEAVQGMIARLSVA